MSPKIAETPYFVVLRSNENEKQMIYNYYHLHFGCCLRPSCKYQLGPNTPNLVCVCGWLGCTPASEVLGKVGLRVGLVGCGGMDMMVKEMFRGDEGFDAVDAEQVV
jgi:hypothetical protein